ncbi:carboxypeptidase-like regulatory domain-containing protein [Crocinitomicaceae bacterium CZZ-1]|uniref:Carboxypeptidase-like regulatory domain-containing protein n=1 Tax=Taishania pollutisoli TaxID=2766479 RepID=A0A8J6P9W4_9FLAO|nr:carboxypeptidase regulatory-like domain-containing protein [Taishania pollutisoli]MBC9811338.1 carboxypeptidase-like regulatory domain-containing protein [Taishania pollutisoli]
MRKLMIAALLMTGYSSSAQVALGEIQGYLVEKSTKEPVPLTHVFIRDLDKVYQVISDEEGMFRISAIPAGTYALQIRYEGDTIKVDPVQIKMNSITQLGKIELAPIQQLGTVYITPGVRLIDGDLPIPQLTGDEIAKSVAKFDPKGLITSMSSEVRIADDGSLVFRGARKGDMIYMIDGIKANDVVTVPSSAIGSMMVYTGALPAKYGDTLGGVVVVETKSYFDLYRAWMAGR